LNTPGSSASATRTQVERAGLRRVPLWAWVVLGWLAGQLARAAARGPVHANAAALAFVRAAQAREGPALEEARSARSLDHVCVRELRALPGIDETRALDIARARWERDWNAGPLRLSAIRGIGPTTETAVAAWFEGVELHELAEAQDQARTAVWLQCPWRNSPSAADSDARPEEPLGFPPARPPEALPPDRG
jgi:hypothetical protein